jgi:hypothetical protein
MKRLIISVFLIATTAFTQSQLGSITGTVSSPDGASIAGITLEIRDAAGAILSTTTTSTTGTFTFSQLAAGSYQLTVPGSGFRFSRYVGDKLSLSPGQINRLDVQLKYANQGVVGDDDAFLSLRKKYEGVTGPAPRTPSGHPDFSGVWQNLGQSDPVTPSTLPWVDGVMKERTENNFNGLPSAHCLPDNLPATSAPLLYKNIQTDSLLVQLFEGEPHYRQIFLDGRDHPKDPDPTWMGHSIGKWEGDTLVVDSLGFNDKSWLAGNRPHTGQLHIIERFRRPDLGHLNIDQTIEDPSTFTKPWTRHMVWQLAADEEILESICNENNRYEENIGTK